MTQEPLHPLMPNGRRVDDSELVRFVQFWPEEMGQEKVPKIVDPVMQLLSMTGQADFVSSRQDPRIVDKIVYLGPSA